MKRILSFCTFLLLAIAAQAQDTKYTVTLNVPDGGTLSAYAGIKSGDYISRRSEFAAGEEVHLTGSLKAEYSCTGWTDESGTLVCDSLHYIFTMPARNVVLTGHTTYDPANPPGPREDGYTDTWNRLYLRSNPEFGGTFTWGPGAEAAQNWLVWTGYEFTVTAYPTTGFKFAGWQLDGKIVSTDNPYTFTMPERDMTLYAMYDYDPETPANPHGNVWNKESGELIISEFVPGHLYEKVREVTSRDPWHSDWDLIKSATIDGPSTDESLTYDYPIDISVFTNLASNVEYIDYSRTSGITKVPRGCFSMKSLKQIVLPATIRTIGEYAFRICESLTTVTCFATTPPTFEGRMPGEQGYAANDYYNNWAFDGLNKDNIIVHVPAEAVPLYQQARGWKELMILPITTGVQRLTVTLPQAKSYNDMFLELVNTKTLQSQRYVITNATSYTFNNLIRHTQHVLYLKNQRGDVLGKVENIDIQDKDVTVSLTDLKPLIDVTLLLLDPQGNQLPSPQGEGQGVGSVTWTDRQGNLLATSQTLTGMMEGTQVNCRVKLGETLGRQYQNPADTLFTVDSQSSIINCQLSIIPQLTLSGTVTSESSGKAVRNAAVAVSQTLNGQYTVTQTAKTDIDGHYALTVYDAPTTVTVTHSSYLKASPNPSKGGESNAFLPSSLKDGVLDIDLRDLTGTIVDIDLSYTAAVADGEETATEEGYSAPENITYSVYDETHGKELPDISVQYPMLVLVDQELSEGTRLRITATSITGDFMPVTTTCTVTDGHATAIFGIKEMGQLKASFEMTDNMQVMGVLYDADGQLVGWAPYKDTELTVTHLKDGDYTLVTMGYSAMATSVASLDRLYQFGIRDNDMVKNEVSINSGRITTVTNSTVPLLDDSRFSYTSDATLFGVNKDEVSVGSYVTLRADLHFKPQYKDMLSKVRLQFDLPEGVEMVENSMMVGNKTVPYEMDDRQVTVLIDDLDDEHLVRFCVVPTRGGLFEVSAGTRFRLNGSTTLQPIGAVRFTATDLTLNVVETTARRSVPVTGMAVPLSEVDVYDGDVVIGHATSLGTGYWSVMCQLDRPYNLSEHRLYAIVTTPEGLQIQSETKTVKVNRSNLTPVVSCTLQSDNFEHKQAHISWDFRTMEVTPQYLGLTTTAFNNCSQTFEVNFFDENDMVANDTTVISDVTLYVRTTRGDVRTYPLNYSERHRSWWIHIDWHDRLPINVDLDYTVLSGVAVERQQLDDMLNDYLEMVEESRQRLLSIFHILDEDNEELEHQAEFDELFSLFEAGKYSEDVHKRINELLPLFVSDSIRESVRQQYGADFTEIDQLLAEGDDISFDKAEHLNQQLLNIYKELSQPLDIHAPELEQSYQDMLAEFKEHMENARDSLLTAALYLSVTDTTAIQLPNGDIREAYQCEDGGCVVVEISHLNTVDVQTLLNEGYTQILTTEGDCVYYYADVNKQIIIDAKTLKRYSRCYMAEEEAVAAGARFKHDLGDFLSYFVSHLTLEVFFPSKCTEKFTYLIRHLQKLEQQTKQASDLYQFIDAVLANTSDLLQGSVDVLGCFYENGVNHLNRLVAEALNGVKKNLDTAQKLAEKSLAEAQEQMAKIAQRINDVKEMEEKLKLNRSIQNGILKSPGFSNTEKIAAQNTLKGIEAQLKAIPSELDDLVKTGNNLKNSLKGLKKNAENAAKKFLNFKGITDWVSGVMKKIPVKYVPKENAIQIGDKLMKNIPILGWLLKWYPIGSLMINNGIDIGEWVKMCRAVHSVLPCEGDPVNAQKLFNDCLSKTIWHSIVDIGQLAGDFASMQLSEVKGWISTACAVWDIASSWIAVAHPEASAKDRKTIKNRLDQLDCDKDPDPEPVTPPATLDTNDPNGNWITSGGSLYGAGVRGGVYRNFKYNNIYYIFDPSGYVYEAVSSNRVEGVRTTCYYKETKEDMYGDLHDEAVVWDAETYAQENPLFTDADGRYQWDVPTGLWQVKYEKQGYETTYSDWLPVPPPQLEVNVGITQLRQPNVQKVKAYTDGIDITFDKYMRPHTLTAASIFLTSGGQQVPGTIELLNAESGYQTPDSVYASKVRFIPSNATLNANDKVMLTVRRTVESYAGVPMEQDFTQQFTVAQRIEALVADSALNLQEGKQATIVIQAVPAAAAKGKKVVVSSSDAEAVAVAQQETTLDSNGAATVALSAEAQGTSIVRFTLADEEELTTTTLVTVRDAAQMQVSAPRSSRLNGITLYIGSEIRLSSATGGATILYTLDGSCPCAPESGKVLTYTGPIVMSGESMTIKAMAVAPGMDDSPVVEFSYKGIQRPSGIEAPTVPNGSHVAEQPVLFFRLDGQRISRPEHGINIVRQSDGTVHKVTVR